MKKASHSSRIVLVSTILVVISTALLVGHLPVQPGLAATPTVPKTRGLKKQAGLPENRYTLGIVTGNPQSTDLLIAYEIAIGLVNGQETGPHGEKAIRVLPIVGTGGMENIADVLALPGIDMAIVPEVILNRVRETKEWADIESKLVYLTPLFAEEVHVLAGAEIKQVYDLAGKTVSLGEEDSAAAVFGRQLFSRLGIKINEVNLELDAALDGLQHGQISAILLIAGKPVRSLMTYTQAEGLHFVPVPPVASLQKLYPSSALRHADYPNLIDVEEAISTVSLVSALIAYDWPPGSERFRLLKLFVETLFSRLPELQAGHHPKWREVDLASTLPTWRRFRPAERWLEQRVGVGAELHHEFERILNQDGSPDSASPALKGIFQEFLRWRKRHGGS